MPTTIGQNLRTSPQRTIVCAVGGFAVAADFALVWWNHYPESLEGRFVLALLGFAAFVYVAKGDVASLGLTLVPVQGWRYWFKATLLIAAAVAAFILTVAVVAVAAFFLAAHGDWALVGNRMLRSMHTTSPSNIGAAFFRMCLTAPVLEETTYRLLLCVPLAACGRARSAIVVSGLLFAALHFLYGNPSPENLIGGLFLAWAYLRSGTILMPLLLHSFGNFLVLLIQVACWYWLQT
jgi:uncharacterized protein